jgi:ketosteroid isomerase-like protein
MSTTEVATGALTDEAAVSDLLSSYWAAIDDHEVTAETVAAMFTEDATWNSPAGTRVGHAAILAGEQSTYSKFSTTLHSTSDHLMRVDGDSATLRANLNAMHVWAPEVRDGLSLQSHFVAGSVLTGDAVRTDAGWRFREMKLQIVWREGWMPLNLLTAGSDKA